MELKSFSKFLKWQQFWSAVAAWEWIAQVFNHGNSRFKSGGWCECYFFFVGCLRFRISRIFHKNVPIVLFVLRDFWILCLHYVMLRILWYCLHHTSSMHTCPSRWPASPTYWSVPAIPRRFYRMQVRCRALVIMSLENIFIWHQINFKITSSYTLWFFFN